MTVNLVLGNFIHSILVIVRNTKKMDKLIYSNYSSAKHYMEASKAKHEKTQLPSTLIRDNFVSGIHFEVQREWKDKWSTNYLIFWTILTRKIWLCGSLNTFCKSLGNLKIMRIKVILDNGSNFSIEYNYLSASAISLSLLYNCQYFHWIFPSSLFLWYFDCFTFFNSIKAGKGDSTACR